MAFRKNDGQQVSFADSFSGLTAREQKAVRNSWAEVFTREIFPNIPEEIFAPMYSTKYSRPNTPVNVIVGMLLLKEMHGLTDDEVLENLLVDLRYQYALRTTSFIEQPASDKTLQRFRRRCAEHELVTGENLVEKCIDALSEYIAKVMDITGEIRRMDSMMIAANIRKMSRMELLYFCVAKVVKMCRKNEIELPERMNHYLERGDRNKRFYHANDDERASVLCEVLGDGKELLEIEEPVIRALHEFGLLERCFKEQVIEENGILRLKTKEDGDMGSDILQNPADPDATYREKCGKGHQGYVANIEEHVGENGSVIMGYQFEKNNYADATLLGDYLNREEASEEPVKLVADGAYSGEENRRLGEEKNIQIVTTALNGAPTDPIFGEFKTDEAGGKIVECPAGHAPVKGGTPSKNGQIRLTFDRDCCANCPHKNECRAKIHKNVSTVTLSMAACNRARLLQYMETEEFEQLRRVRNGVETVPAALRNKYHADRMPVRGLIRSRHMFGFKVGALNIKKLLTYRRSRGKYAQNPILEGC